jgi:hypothetical protein
MSGIQALLRDAGPAIDPLFPGLEAGVDFLFSTNQ